MKIQIKLLAEFFNDIKPVTMQFRVGMVLKRVIKPSDWKFYFKRFATGGPGNLHHQTKKTSFCQTLFKSLFDVYQ